MKAIHLWPEEIRTEDGLLRRALVIEEPEKPRRTLWWEVEEKSRDFLPSDHDHLVMGTVFFLLQAGLDAHVHGQVSPSLLRNLVEFQNAWAQMLPGLTVVEITADQEVEASPRQGRRAAVVAFSGGVDSCFTAYRHVRGEGLRFPRQIDGAVMIHGFDIPLADVGPFRRAAERSRRILDSLGLELMTVRSNYKDVVTDFPHSHGPAIASCLALFGGGFREGLIGQTFTYGEIRDIAEGVNALTDPMLSSGSFRIIPDGAAFERADKISLLSEWDEFLRNLRVCWAGPDKDRNCCRCEKCIRNILTFRALGLGLPPCFEHDVSDEQIAAIQPGLGTRPALRYGGLGELAAASGSTGPWVEVLQKRLEKIDRARRRPAIIRKLRKRLSCARGLLKGPSR